jgi:hypothetical protein
LRLPANVRGHPGADCRCWSGLPGHFPSFWHSPPCACAGAITATVVCPLDVLKTRLQVQGKAGAAMYKGVSGELLLKPPRPPPSPPGPAAARGAAAAGAQAAGSAAARAQAAAGGAAAQYSYEAVAAGERPAATPRSRCPAHGGQAGRQAGRLVALGGIRHARRRGWAPASPRVCQARGPATPAAPPPPPSLPSAPAHAAQAPCPSPLCLPCQPPTLAPLGALTSCDPCRPAALPPSVP